jgi:hypothetical protein
MLFVLDFRFGERRAAVDAPVDGLLSLVDEALLDECAQGTGDRGLVLEIHREVRVIPVAENPQALELLCHDANEPFRVPAARAAEIGGAHFALLRSELAIDLELDRQTVTVVARHVRCVESGHRARLDDEVFEDLVERRAQMDLSVRVRRAVVQHVLRRPAPAFTDEPVQVHGCPPRKRFGLAGRQIGLHREPRPGQVQCVFPVGHLVLWSVNCTLERWAPPKRSNPRVSGRPTSTTA